MKSNGDDNGDHNATTTAMITPMIRREETKSSPTNTKDDCF